LNYIQRYSDELKPQDFKLDGRYNPNKAVNALINKLITKWITPMNDQGGDVIWWYDAEEGIYKPTGVPMVEWIIKNVMGDEVKTRQINETIKLLKIETYMEPAEFQPEKHLIVLNNGTLDIEKQELGWHEPLAYLRSRLPVDYNPNADCPRIKQFIEEILPDDVEQIQEWFGYHLLKDYPYQKAFIFTGSGANGKSTLFQLLTAFLGPENVSNQTLYDLTSNRFAVAELHGKLANISPDVGADELKRTGTFKALTGGDWIKAERKNRDPFKFKNYAKLSFACNQLPTSPDESYAFFRRFIIFELKKQFTGALPYRETHHPRGVERSAQLGIRRSTTTQGTRILQNVKVSRGTTAILHGAKYPGTSVRTELSVRNCLVENENSMLSKDQMYNAYCAYCKVRGFVSRAKNKFSQELTRHIFLNQSQKTLDGVRVRVWLGAELICGSTPYCAKCVNCTGRTGRTGISFSENKNNLKLDIEKHVQPVQPVQQGLTRMVYSEELEKLLGIIREAGEVTEFELIEDYGYSDVSLLRRMLKVLVRDGVVFQSRPGVWRLV